jgi:hypothetical protein
MRKEAAVFGRYLIIIAELICIFLINMFLSGGKSSQSSLSRAFHMLRGEAISWLYAMIFLDALYMVQKDIETKTNSESLSLLYEG